MKPEVQSLRALFVSVFCVQLATAALGTLVALRIAELGGSGEAASLIAASYSLGFLIGCFMIFRPLRRVGYIRSFAGLAAICSLGALMMSQTDTVPVLFLARFSTGLATAGLYAIGDAWVNDSADPDSRGGTISLYYFVLGVASVLSQGFVPLFSSDLAQSFVVMSALYNIAIVVLAATRTRPPEIASEVSLRVRAALKEAPLAVIGVFANGFVVTLVLSVMPYEASVLGMPPNVIALVVGAVYAGRILLQLPLGNLSDEVDRRVVITGVAFVCTILLLLIWRISLGDGFAIMGERGLLPRILSVLCALLLGGTLMPLYGLLVSHAIDRTVPVFVGATAITLLFVYTVGCIVGPAIGSLTTSAFGGRSIFALCAVVMGIVTLYGALRLQRVEAVAQAETAVGVVAAPTSVALAPVEKRPE